MLKTISDTIASRLCDVNLVTEEEKEIYSYGIHLTLMGLITCLTILSIGCCLNKFLLSLFFIVSLVSLRHYTGGYHAQSYIKCYMISCLSYLGVILIIVYLPAAIQVKTAFWLGLAGSIGIFKMGSLNSSKNPKTVGEMKKRKLYARLTVVVYLLSIGIGTACFSTYVDLWFLMACNLVITTTAMLIAKIKGGKE